MLPKNGLELSNQVAAGLQQLLIRRKRHGFSMIGVGIGETVS